MVLVVCLGAGCTRQTTVSPAGEVAVVADGEITVMPLNIDEQGVAMEQANDTEIAESLPELSVAMEAKSFSFTPSTISAKPGQTVAVTFTSDGDHGFAIDEIGLADDVTTGETLRFVAPTTPGEYPFYCPHGSHAALGMRGALLVE